MISISALQFRYDEGEFALDVPSLAIARGESVYNLYEETTLSKLVDRAAAGGRGGDDEAGGSAAEVVPQAGLPARASTSWKGGLPRAWPVGWC